MKRKEQNRAAQRAFRERKEKHVKDVSNLHLPKIPSHNSPLLQLEDKVAALEERNNTTVAENETLREVIQRLQNENVRLREASFTFSVPSTSGSGSSSSRSRAAATSSASHAHTSRSPTDLPPQDTPMTLFGSPPSATSSSTASTHDSPQSLFLNEKGDSQQQLPRQQQQVPMSFFGRPPEQTATADAMGLDFGFGPVSTETPYTTIASNPMFMSFREPEPPQYSLDPSSQGNGSYGLPQSFSSWPDVNMLDNLQAFDLTNSLDELFGAASNIGNNGPLDYQYKNLSASQSPVSHHNSKSPVSSVSTNVQQNGPNGQPNGNVNPTPPQNNTTSHDAPASSDSCSAGTCPKTKEAFANVIAKDKGSIFVPKSSPPASSSGSTSYDVPPPTAEFVPCSNLQLPKTLRSDKNVEVMSAWKIIQSDPKFQVGLLSNQFLRSLSLKLDSVVSGR